LRARTRKKEGLAVIGGLATLIVVRVMMNEFPYRTFSYRDFERVEVNGIACYVTGETADELLVLCPGQQPPRNRAVRRSDPGVHRTGVHENVFRGVVRP